MKTKIKAKELVDKFQYLNYKSKGLNYHILLEPLEAKQCTLICINELMQQNGELYLNGLDGDYYRKKNTELFEIKKELNKL